MSEGLRKNKKKIMAVLVIILMIVFVIDIGARRGGTDPSLNEVIGYVGEDGAKITNAEYRQAVADWDLLTRGELGQFTPRFLSEVVLNHLPVQGQDFFAQFIAMQAMQAMQQVVGNIDEQTYMLLVEEANRLGIEINRDRREGVVANLADLPSADPEARQRAVLNWLNVLEVFYRMAGAVKVSPGHAIHEVAEQQQQVSLQVVPFSAADFKEKVAEPTPEQLQAHFQKYRDADAEANEFGVGYRFPHRVKVEFVKIPKDAIAKTVSDEDIYKYWKDNQAQFQRPPDTQPAAMMPEGPLGPSATTMPTSAPATAAASTQPTTRPWTEVKDQIRDILANQRASAMVTAVNQVLRSDWPNFREAVRSAGPAAATQPSKVQTSLGVPYNTYVYLQELQKRVQKQKDSRGVLPELFWDDNLLTRRELEQLPGIGKSRVRTQEGRPIPFAQYAIENAEAFMTRGELRKAQELQLQTLALYQPSPPFFEEATGNYYIFRLTAAEAAHPAESLAVVESRVREDWKSLQAYELAKEAARKFLEEAKAKGLEQAAGDRRVITTGLFRSDLTTESLPTYSLSPGATRRLIVGGFDLLGQGVKNKEEHPVGVIDLPRAFTSVVARVAESTPATKDQFFAIRVQQSQQTLEFQRVLQLAQKWFDPQAVAERTKFKPTELAPETSRRRPSAPPPVFPGM